MIFAVWILLRLCHSFVVSKINHFSSKIKLREDIQYNFKFHLSLPSIVYNAFYLLNLDKDHVRQCLTIAVTQVEMNWFHFSHMYSNWIPITFFNGFLKLSNCVVKLHQTFHKLQKSFSLGSHHINEFRLNGKTDKKPPII